MAEYGYVFQIDYGPDGVELRRYCDVSFALGRTYQQYEAERTATNAALNRMGAEVESHDSKVTTLLGILGCGQLSERFSGGGGTYCLKTEDPMTVDELHTFLNYKYKRGELKALLEEAKL